MNADDRDDFAVEDDEDDEIEVMDFDSERGSDNEDSDNGDDPDSGDDDSASDDFKSDSDSEEDEEQAAEGGVTIERLHAKIKEAEEALKFGKRQLNEFQKQRKGATDMLATLKKTQSEAQREKNTICSLKRSKVWLLRATSRPLDTDSNARSTREAS